MSNNKKKFLKLVSMGKSEVLNDIRWRRENRSWLQKSQAISIKILRTLRKNKNNKISPSDKLQLSEKLGVDIHIVNEMVKGREKFNHETISKLEDILKIKLI